MRRKRADIVETAIERVKFVDRYGSAKFLGAFCNCLTDVAVVVHHLRNSESYTEEVRAVARRTWPDGFVRRRSLRERFDQLIEKEWHTVLELFFCYMWTETQLHFGSGTSDNLSAVGGHEFMEH